MTLKGYQKNRRKGQHTSGTGQSALLLCKVVGMSLEYPPSYKGKEKKSSVRKLA